MSINELLSLHGKRALVTGATGYLGKVIAETLAEMGANLILVDVNQDSLSRLQRYLCERWKISAFVMKCDFESDTDKLTFFNKIKNEFNSLDILINNAAFVGSSNLSGWICNFEQQTVETWNRAINVNLNAVFDVTKNLVPLLNESMDGVIINISSIYGVVGPDHSLYVGTDMGNPAAYSASKAGVIQLTRWLAATLAPNIRVNSISPGGIFRNQPKIFVERYVSKVPLGRMATEDDIKGAIIYLSSNLSRYVTGQNLVVDGGITVC